MSENSKELTKLVQSIKRNLKKEHAVDVPYSALRAVFLQAKGEHPHAFGTRVTPADEVNRLKALLARAPMFFAPDSSFDGEKLAWLEEAKLVPKEKPDNAPASVVKKPTDMPLRKVFLAMDNLGLMERISLDAAGDYLLPDFWAFPTRAKLVAIKAMVPRINKYGLPDFVMEPLKFFDHYFSLTLAKDFVREYKDSGDDSGESCEMTVAMSDSAWGALVADVLGENSNLEDCVAEWVGLHYGKCYDQLKPLEKADWVMRYLEAPEGLDADEPLSVKFEWVYPDEDGDSCMTTVNLATGQLLLDNVAQLLTKGVADSSVRRRIWSDEDEDLCFDVVYLPHKGSKVPGDFFVTTEGLAELHAALLAAKN